MSQVLWGVRDKAKLCWIASLKATSPAFGGKRRGVGLHHLFVCVQTCAQELEEADRRGGFMPLEDLMLQDCFCLQTKFFGLTKGTIKHCKQ